MCGPHYTDPSSGHVTDSILCASDLVFQTASIVINEDDEVLMIEDPVSGIAFFPRSRTPHCLDNLVKMPLGFLAETGVIVEPLPLCKLDRRYHEPDEIARGSEPVELAFSEQQTRTTPFAVALDVAYLPFCNMARIADVRQSIVWWYAGMTRTRLSDIPEQKRQFVHFLSMYDAEFLLLNRPPFDSVSLDALRLFRDAWNATRVLPPQVRQFEPADGCTAARSLDSMLRPAGNHDVPCFPSSIIEYAIHPVWTSNTTRIQGHAFWAPPDILVQTGTVLFDPEEGCVLLVSYSTPPNINVPDIEQPTFTLPRGTSDDIGALLQDPLACARIECSRLDLPRLGKRYFWEEGREDPVAMTDVLTERTTNPFMVSLNTHWDQWEATLEESKGRQALTYWYGGTFDSSLLHRDSHEYMIVEPDEARVALKMDVYALTALNMFLALYKVREADIQASQVAVVDADGHSSRSP